MVNVMNTTIRAAIFAFLTLAVVGAPGCYWPGDVWTEGLVTDSGGESDTCSTYCCPGERICNAGDLYVCASDGAGYSLFRECPNGCESSACMNCVAKCGASECGMDPVCGTQNCGTCGDGYSCQSGECVKDACVPACGASECGLDPVCGTQNCGNCTGTDVCVAGECVWQVGDYTVSCSGGECLVPAGSFWMGCNSAVDSNCYSDESPYHEVTLSGYYMDKTEVTQAEYKKCVDAGECDTPSCDWDPTGTPNRPVVCVTWSQAGEYCVWAGKRLPTEAEWEKAARGTDGRKYPWGNETATCDYAVMYDGSWGCGTGSTWDVCGKSPAGDSPYGLCDMAGNVYEWVSDWYDSGYYTNSQASNPTGPVSGSIRVARGGSFDDDDYYLRASNRDYVYPSVYHAGLGFRCVRPQ